MRATRYSELMNKGNPIGKCTDSTVLRSLEPDFSSKRADTFGELAIAA